MTSPNPSLNTQQGDAYANQFPNPAQTGNVADTTQTAPPNGNGPNTAQSESSNEDLYNTTSAAQTQVSNDSQGLPQVAEIAPPPTHGSNFQGESPDGVIIAVPTPETAQPLPANGLPAPAPILFDANLPANPVLYFHANSAGGTNLRVAAANPGGGWARVEQFCAYLATYWLTNGASSGGLWFATLSAAAQQVAVHTLIAWGSAGGLAAQQNHARQQLGGQTIASHQVQQTACQDGYTQGTRIWFGSNQHAQAAVVLANGRYCVYDPNTGNTQEMSGSQFAQYVQRAGANAFVIG